MRSNASPAACLCACQKQNCAGGTYGIWCRVLVLHRRHAHLHADEPKIPRVAMHAVHLFQLQAPSPARDTDSTKIHLIDSEDVHPDEDVLRPFVVAATEVLLQCTQRLVEGGGPPMTAMSQITNQT